MTRLTPHHLGEISVSSPVYDRSSHGPTIVHFGVGAFHRAHQAYYLDTLLSRGGASWGIVGVGLLPQDRATRDASNDQAGLYTLTTLSPDGGSETRVIGSIREVRYAPDDPPGVVDLLAASTTRIVSLTITEGGYGIDDSSGEFVPSDPLTRQDLEGCGPSSVWGYLADGLRRRRAAGIAPFAVMSCDNIQGNGAVARQALTSFMQVNDPELAAWTDAEVAFPSSMVDRITPVVTPDLRSYVREVIGLEDQWPVRSESFIQWVLEDEFPNGRPELEAVGVQMVSDVAPYERMKLRLLNASHQAMSYLGLLQGFTMVDQTCSDPDMRAFLLRYMHREALPTLGEIPGIDLDRYCDQLIERFSSPTVADTLERQVVDASDRLPKFLLPVLRDQLETGGEIDCMALVLAAWGAYLEGFRSTESKKLLPDRRADELVTMIALESDAPGSLLTYSPVFGDLGRNPRLRQAYLAARSKLLTQGAAGAVDAMVPA